MVELTCSLSKEKPLPFHSFTWVPTIPSFLAMPMHVGVMNINVLSGMYLEPQNFFSYLKKMGGKICGPTSLLWFKSNVKIHECSLSFRHNWVFHYKVICRDPLGFYKVKASPPLVGNILARTTLRVNHNVV